jgi:hypothetical protein
VGVGAGEGAEEAGEGVAHRLVDVPPRAARRSAGVGAAFSPHQPSASLTKTLCVCARGVVFTTFTAAAAFPADEGLPPDFLGGCDGDGSGRARSLAGAASCRERCGRDEAGEAPCAGGGARRERRDGAVDDAAAADIDEEAIRLTTGPRTGRTSSRGAAQRQWLPTTTWTRAYLLILKGINC